MKRRLGFAILVMGFSGLAAQMLILRELLIVFSGNELSIGIILANWLILEALGSFCAGKKAETLKHRIEIFALVTIFFCLSLPAAVYSARILKNILGVSIGEPLGLGHMLYSSFVLLAPASISHGALFTLSCKIYSELPAGKDSPAGRVYFLETTGTIAGGAALTYLFIPYMHAFNAAAIIAIVNFFACILLLAPGKRPSKPRIAVIICLLFLLVPGGTMIARGGADIIHRISVQNQWKNQNVVHYQNSVYGNICVIEKEGQYTFFIDGVPEIHTPVPDMASIEEFVNLPLLAHPAPAKMLVIGGGAGGVIDEILKHPTVELVNYLELDPLIPELLIKFSTPLTERELGDERVRIRHIDGRLFLRMTDKKYDLIFVGPSGPSDLQTNRFFTEEFFRLAAERMNGRGILVLSAPGSFTLLNDELRTLNACIHGTLGAVFNHIRVIPGEGRNLFLASNSENVSLIDQPLLTARMKERGLEPEVLVPWHIESKLHPRWEEWFSDFTRGITPRINRDFLPAGLFYAISYWNAVFAPRLGVIFKAAERITPGMFALAFLVFIFFSAVFRARGKIFPGRGVPFCTFSTGFAGMIFDLALIFAFQSLYGFVFSWIGLLVASFMAGAASGAKTSASALARVGDDTKFLAGIEAAIILFASVLPLIFTALHPYFTSPQTAAASRWLFLGALFAGGFLTGSQFPAANKMYLQKSSISRTAGLLYGSDLLGGWLGGILGGVILLPVLGFAGTCMVVVLLKLSSFIIIIMNRKPKT